MARGSFTVAVTGMLAQQDKMAVIGNNIANSRTVGFKASSLGFAEEFVTHSGQFVNGVHNQFGNGVKAAGVSTDWASGAVESTSLPSNLAIAGDGFYPVEYQGELFFTRAADFSLVNCDNIDGFGTPGFIFQRPNGAILLGRGNTTDDITTGPGHYVSFQDSVAAPPVPPATINYGTAPSSYEINPEGRITALPATIMVANTNVGIQRFNNPDSLQRIEGGLYRETSLTSRNTPAPAVPGEDGAGTVVQGALENSNVDLVTEFTDMIITQRAFQANSKTITTADEMLQTVLNLKR